MVDDFGKKIRTSTLVPGGFVPAAKAEELPECPERPPSAVTFRQIMPLTPSNIRPGEAAQCRYLQPKPDPTGR